MGVNADKTTYRVMSGDKKAGQTHNTKTDSSSFESGEVFSCLGTNLNV